ncbi:MAG: DUF4245 domain-containing protein [Marinilabiliales bacterium]|nr:DUF4245 domain-containing protein [Marinilabiliales bacterium]
MGSRSASCWPGGCAASTDRSTRRPAADGGPWGHVRARHRSPAQASARIRDDPRHGPVDGRRRCRRAGGVFWMVAWQRPEVQGPIRPEADVEQVFTDVRVGDTFPVLEPVDLPDGWTPTSAWFDSEQVSGVVGGGVLHVGYLTSEGSYAELRQTDGDRAAAVDEWVDGAVRTGEVQVGDGVWDLVESEETGEGRPGTYRRGCDGRRDREGRPGRARDPGRIAALTLAAGCAAARRRPRPCSARGWQPSAGREAPSSQV